MKLTLNREGVYQVGHVVLVPGVNDVSAEDVAYLQSNPQVMNDAAAGWIDGLEADVPAHPALPVPDVILPTPDFLNVTEPIGTLDVTPSSAESAPEQVAEILENNAKNADKAIRLIEDKALLFALQEAEQAGQKRSTVLSVINLQLEKLGA